MRQGETACCPDVCQPLVGGAGLGRWSSPLESGLPLLQGPLAIFSPDGLPVPTGTEVLPGSLGKMSMAIPRSFHVVRDLGTGRDQAHPLS